MKANDNKRIAVIRIRGQQRVKSTINATLKMLRLHKKHYCSVHGKTESIMGMLNKVKDYVSYGDLDEDTFKLLMSKRGEPYKGPTKDRKGKIHYNRFVEFENKKYKRYFRLMPPQGGFEKKGIKVAFTNGGALGDRKGKINDLIRRMV